MSSANRSSFLLAIFCIAFLLIAVPGPVPAGAIIEPVACIGACSSFPNCNKACTAKGYVKGGECMGFSVTSLACCCNRT